MITDDKIRELQKKVRSGFPEGEIREELKNSGYSDEDIAKVFTPHNYDMRSWYLIFGIVLSLVGIWLYLDRKSVFGLILSGFLFFQYYQETKRLKNLKNSDQNNARN